MRLVVLPNDTYGWLGAFPQMREWIGDRVIKDITEFAYQIINQEWESTLGVDRADSKKRDGIVAELCKEKCLKIGDAWKLLKEAGYGSSTAPETSEGPDTASATMEYAAVHQFGAEIKPKSAPALFVPGYGMLKKVTIPARPYLGVSPHDMKAIENAVAVFLGGLIK